MTGHPLAERLTRLLMQAGYRLDRAEIVTIDDGLFWAGEWHTEDGQYSWMGASDRDRRRFVKHGLWLRWRHSQVIRDRGLSDDR
jgi:hypothetical protein